MPQTIPPEQNLFNGKKPPKSSGQPESVEILSSLGGQSWAENIDCKKANKVLAVFISLLMILVTLSLFNKKEISLKKISEIPVNLVAPAYTSPVVSYQSLSFYLQQVMTRDIFHPVLVKSAPAVNKAPAPNTNFMLSGIYVGQYPQAIITDKSDQQTYFLKVGDQIKGYKVKLILKDKVILKQGEEETELK